MRTFWQLLIYAACFVYCLLMVPLALYGPGSPAWYEWRGGRVEAAPIPDSNVAVYFSPGTECQEAVVQQINHAKETILCAGYGFDAEPITDALIAAHNRKVAVRIVLDQSNLHQHWSHIGKVHAAGLPVWTDAKEPIAHSKVFVIDSKTVITGSYNWTVQATKNSENMLVISDKTIAKKYADVWEHHREHSTEFKGVLP